MPEFLDTDDEKLPDSEPFAELGNNLDYARDLVRGGRFLEHLQVRAFDVSDLYRAAWVQAVSALDQWVHRELYDRALAYALDASVKRPARFLKIEVPMSLFEDVHHHSKTMHEAFRTHLQQQYGHLSFQAPEKIKQAIAVISDVPLWLNVAKVLSADSPGSRVTPEEVQARLLDIVKRRNRIAHEADRDPNHQSARQRVTDHDATRTIDWLGQVAAAILKVIGPPPPMKTDDANHQDAPLRKKWSRLDVDQALEQMSDQPARDALSRLLKHADDHDAMFRGGVGPEPSAGIYYWFQGYRRSLWSVYVTSVRPCVALSLGSVWPRDADLALRMLHHLRTDPSLDAALLHEDEVLVRKYPVFPLATIGKSPAAVDTIIHSLDLAIQAHGAH